MSRYGPPEYHAEEYGGGSVVISETPKPVNRKVGKRYEKIPTEAWIEYLGACGTWQRSASLVRPFPTFREAQAIVNELRAQTEQFTRE